ncbi:MAG: NapC/NirT family cytochrome c [Vicinamibacterales bacterium]
MARSPLETLKGFTRNGLSLAGIAIATAMAVLFVILAALETAGFLANPYLGLLLFAAIPLLLVAGLALIPLGLVRQRRRERLRPDEPTDWPVLDFRNARQRTIALAVLVLTAVNLIIVSLAAYGGVHYMETSEFCGQVCHATMEPQFVAHQGGPHARIACVNCHVGEGADALVQSKLQGLRQLMHVATGRVPRPVPSSPHRMRPARETCERCHWPDKFHGDRPVVARSFASDEGNTESATRLTLHLGGTNPELGIAAGIHGRAHVAGRVEFVATDTERQQIPYVRYTDPAGVVTEFVARGTDRASFAAQPAHRMDCLDCHDRPAHAFSVSADRAVDAAIAEGRLPRDVPFLRREVIAAVGGTYATREAARAGIAARLQAAYAARGLAPDRIRQVVGGAQDVYVRNVFPAMRVTFGTYGNNLGHMDSPGCFRCHDDEHVAADGRTIGQDCESCHTAPE